MSRHHFLISELRFPKREKFRQNIRDLLTNEYVRPLNEHSDIVKDIVSHFINDAKVCHISTGISSISYNSEINKYSFYDFDYTIGDDIYKVYVILDVPIYTSDITYDTVPFRWLPRLSSSYESKVISIAKNKTLGYIETFMGICMIKYVDGEFDLLNDDTRTCYFIPVIIKNTDNGKLNTDGKLRLKSIRYGNAVRTELDYNESSDDYNRIVMPTLVRLSSSHPILLQKSYYDDSIYNQSLLKKVITLSGADHLKDIYVNFVIPRTYDGQRFDNTVNFYKRVPNEIYTIDNGTIIDNTTNERFRSESIIDDGSVTRGSVTYNYGNASNSRLLVSFKDNWDIVKEIKGNVSFSSSVSSLIVGPSSNDLYMLPYGINGEYGFSHVNHHFSYDEPVPIYDLDGMIQIDGVSYGLSHEKTIIGFKYEDSIDDHYILENDAYVNESGDKATAYVIDSSLLNSIEW